MAVSSRDRRIAKELQDIQADRDNSGVFATPRDGTSLSKLLGTIPGPPDTPYAGGSYEIEIEIPDTYPFKSPLMKFKTRVWHPNISSQTGAICLDTLGAQWSPVQTIKTALLSLRMLLEAPNPKDPQDAEVASQMNNDPGAWATKAQKWAVDYASAPRQDLDLSRYDVVKEEKDELARLKGFSPELVARWTSMGFEVEAVVRALEKEKITPAQHLSEPMLHAVTERLLAD